MKWNPACKGVLSVLPVLAVMPSVAHSAVYLTVPQAQQAMFGQAQFQLTPLKLTSDQQAQLKKSSGIYRKFDDSAVYEVKGGGWFIVDKVIGKHELITYAVGLTADGAVKQVEILEYNESYGGQVRNADWRKQFVGKTVAQPVKLGKDIANISGATLSSKNVADGVRRILQVHQLYLKPLK